MASVEEYGRIVCDLLSEIAAMLNHADSLETIAIANPCPVAWDNMTGDDNKRFCRQCQLYVCNRSAMSQEEAEIALE